MSTCRDPIAHERLVDYWSGELAGDELERVEEHLFACAECSRASARVAALTEALREMIPPLVDDAAIAALRARGLTVVEGSFAPGERKDAVFAPGVDLLIHRLGGLDLARAASVRVFLRVEHSGEVILDLPGAPFEAARGEVLIACQRHFAAFPPDIVAEVRVATTDGRETVATYAIPHRFA